MKTNDWGRFFFHYEVISGSYDKVNLEVQCRFGLDIPPGDGE